MIRMTLDCVGLTQSSVITDHSQQCWSEVVFFIYLNTCYYLKFALTFIFHKVV